MRGGSFIDIAILEQAKPELVAQQTARADINARFADLTIAYQFDQRFRTGFPAKLIDAGLQRLDNALGQAEMLDTPGARRKMRAGHIGISQRPPVGANHAIKAVLLTQQAGDDALVESEADRLVLGVNRHAVVRHDHGGAGFKGSFKRQEVIVEVIARIDLFTPIFKVRILAVFLWSPAGKMFGHAGDALSAKLRALEATDVRGCQLSPPSNYLHRKCRSRVPSAARSPDQPSGAKPSAGRQRGIPDGRFPANSSTSFSSPMAAKPGGSGH